MALNDKDFEELSEYLSGRMSPDKREHFRKRLIKNRELSEMAETLEDFLKTENEIEWGRMSHPAHELLTGILRDFGQKDQNCAVRIFDSRHLPAPEGVRPAAVETRRLKYRLGEHVLEISLYPVSPSAFELIGQISGLENPLEIEIRDGSTKKKVNTNEFGLFRFERLEKADCTITIISGKEAIGRVEIDLL